VGVDHIDTYPTGTVVNFQRSRGSVVLAKILGPSECGADYQSFTYECGDTWLCPYSMDVSPLCPAPAAGEPIPVAVEHVQLFKVKCSRQKKWHAEPVSQ
jgi:hypothetical protein